MAESSDRMRLDKWLWVARFFKTRSLASESIDAGKVSVNGVRAKRAREVGAGDEISFTREGSHSASPLSRSRRTAARR